MSKVYKVFLDPGHGGNNPGAIGNGLQEKNLTLSVVKYCRDYLAQYKDYIEVNLSRDTDATLTIENRAKKANDWQADLFISVHFNSASGINGDGIEAIHSIVGGEGKEFAQLAVNTVSELTGQNKRPTPIYSRADIGGRDYFGVIRLTKAPAIILECAFINNPEDIKDFNEEHELKGLGIALAKAILKHYGVKETVSVPVDNEYYRLCVGSYAQESNAKTAIEYLSKKGLVCYKEYVESMGIYRIFVVPHTTREQLQNLQETCKSLDVSTFLIQE